MTKEKWEQQEQSGQQQPYVLTAAFLRAVIASNQFDAPGYDKVEITGAKVVDKLNLERISVRFPITLSDMDFQDEVIFDDVATNYNISITNSEFKKGVSFWRFQSSQSLKLSGAPEWVNKVNWSDKHNTVNLDLIRVEGAVALENFDGVEFSAVSARVGQYIELKNSIFRREISFETLSANQIDLVGVHLPEENGPLLTESLEKTGVAQQVCNERPILNGVRVALSVFISGSKFPCGVSIRGAQVGGDVNLLGLTVGDVDLTGSRIGGDLQIGPRIGPGQPQALSGGTQTQTEQEPTGFKWVDGARLVLSNAHVNMVRAAFDDWPRDKICCKNKDFNTKFDTPFYEKSNLRFISPCVISNNQRKILKDKDEEASKPDIKHLGSFLYEIFGGYGLYSSEPAKAILVNGFNFNGFAAPDSCFVPKNPNDPVYNIPEIGNFSSYQVEQWLKNASVSSSIFEVLARQARESGEERISRRMQLIEKSIENKQATNFRLVLLTAARWTTGYGYYNGIAGIWATFIWYVGFIFAKRAKGKGAVVLRSRPGKKSDISPMLFSIDLLLPIIRIDEKNYEVEITSPLEKHWFYIHKILGFVIGGFLFGGLAGLGH